MKILFSFLFIALILGTTDSLSKPAVSVIYSYPKHNAFAVDPGTNIGFRFSQPIDTKSLTLEKIDVLGFSNRKYSGILKLSRNRSTVIFVPSGSFALGDSIHVRLASVETLSGEKTLPCNISFSIRKNIAAIDTSFHSDDLLLERQIHSDDLWLKKSENTTQANPELNILNDENPSEGNLYMTGHAPSPFAAILDKDGKILTLLQNRFSQYGDFKPYRNKTYSYFDSRLNYFIILDSNFLTIDTIRASGLYKTDEHEICRTSEGNYIIIGYDFVTVDMREFVKGGDSAAIIFNHAVLEYDADHNLIFEWRAIDHFKITDATYEDFFGSSIDFCHMNAIDFDIDSNLLISSRHMDEITKIDRKTGVIIWRWGGKNNEFTLEGDSVWFSHQHAIRYTEDGTYTLFDNGNFRSSGRPFSRAVEYTLDQEHKIATKKWEFSHTPHVFSRSMGFVQRLPNKSSLIGWGDCDSGITATEVDANNITHFEMSMLNRDFSYRVFKYDGKYFQTPPSLVRPPDFPLETIRCIPNPSTDHTTIYCSISQKSHLRLSLFDQLGRELQQLYNGILEKGSYSFRLNCSHLASGAYHLRAFTGISSSDQIIIIR